MGAFGGFRHKAAIGDAAWDPVGLFGDVEDGTFIPHTTVFHQTAGAVKVRWPPDQADAVVHGLGVRLAELRLGKKRSHQPCGGRTTGHLECLLFRCQLGGKAVVENEKDKGRWGRIRHDDKLPSAPAAVGR